MSLFQRIPWFSSVHMNYRSALGRPGFSPHWWQMFERHGGLLPLQRWSPAVGCLLNVPEETDWQHTFLFSRCHAVKIINVAENVTWRDKWSRRVAKPRLVGFVWSQISLLSWLNYNVCAVIHLIVPSMAWTFLGKTDGVFVAGGLVQSGAT